MAAKLAKGKKSRDRSECRCVSGRQGGRRHGGSRTFADRSGKQCQPLAAKLAMARKAGIVLRVAVPVADDMAVKEKPRSRRSFAVQLPRGQAKSSSRWRRSEEGDPTNHEAPENHCQWHTTKLCQFTPQRKDHEAWQTQEKSMRMMDRSASDRFSDRRHGSASSSLKK